MKNYHNNFFNERKKIFMNCKRMQEIPEDSCIEIFKERLANKDIGRYEKINNIYRCTNVQVHSINENEINECISTLRNALDKMKQDNHWNTDQYSVLLDYLKQIINNFPETIRITKDDGSTKDVIPCLFCSVFQAKDIFNECIEEEEKGSDFGGNINKWFGDQLLWRNANQLPGKVFSNWVRPEREKEMPEMHKLWKEINREIMKENILEGKNIPLLKPQKFTLEELEEIKKSITNDIENIENICGKHKCYDWNGSKTTYAVKKDLIDAINNEKVNMYNEPMLKKPGWFGPWYKFDDLKKVYKGDETVEDFCKKNKCDLTYLIDAINNEKVNPCKQSRLKKPGLFGWFGPRYKFDDLKKVYKGDETVEDFCKKNGCEEEKDYYLVKLCGKLGENEETIFQQNYGDDWKNLYYYYMYLSIVEENIDYEKVKDWENYLYWKYLNLSGDDEYKLYDKNKKYVKDILYKSTLLDLDISRQTVEMYNNMISEEFPDLKKIKEQRLKSNFNSEILGECADDIVQTFTGETQKKTPEQRIMKLKLLEVIFEGNYEGDEGEERGPKIFKIKRKLSRKKGIASIEGVEAKGDKWYYWTVVPKEHFDVERCDVIMVNERKRVISEGVIPLKPEGEGVCVLWELDKGKDLFRKRYEHMIFVDKVLDVNDGEFKKIEGSVIEFK